MTDQANGVTPAAPEPVVTATDNSPSSQQSTTQPTSDPQPANPVPVETPATNQQPNQAGPTNSTQPAAKESSILPKEVKVDPALELNDEIKQKIANGDEKLLKELNKYKNLADVVKSKVELQSQFSKTRPIPQLPKDATPEQIKEYREAAGIPETWDKYDTTLDKGLVIGEVDKPIVDAYLQKFHEANLRPDEVKKVLQIHFEHQQQQMTEALKLAEQHEQQTVSSLKEQLGHRYEESLLKTTSFLKETLGDETLEKLRQSVAPDGTFILNDPKILNYFVEASQKRYGNPTPPPSEGAKYTSILTRKAELEKISKSNPKLWYDSPEMRAEYAEISQQISKKK